MRQKTYPSDLTDAQWAHLAPLLSPEKPGGPRYEVATLTPEQVGALLAAANGDRFEALWSVAAYSGCRQGELLGLQWDDIAWEAGTISIRRTLAKAAGGVPSFADPKTQRGRRLVPLAEPAMAALRAQRERQDQERQVLGADYADHGLVFATHTGTALQARNVIRAFKALLERAGLARSVRFHDLRHTVASLLLAAGTDVPTTAAILGHAQASTTLNVYAHALPSNVTAAAQCLEQTITGKSCKPRKPPAA